MPSPFPGMDPWLEDPARWPGVHSHLIAAVQFVLNAIIRPRYLAVIEERVFIADDPEARRLVGVSDALVNPGPGGPGVAGEPALLDSPQIMQAVPTLRVRERRVELVDVAGGEVITVIEVLSPTNKRAGSTGRADFLRKRRQVLHSTANWVEIDLLRDGQPTFRRPAGRPAEYAVHVSPVGLRPKARVHPLRLTDRLPVVGVPLRSSDQDAALDLGTVLSDAYYRGALDGYLRYDRPPVPPLPPDLDAWADALLREKGLR
ncbi:MAG: DUF4058 family protein [Gemmataceae bacterium]